MQELYEMIWREKKEMLLALIAGTISGLTAVALFAQSGYLISKAALMPPFYVILILTAFLKIFGVAKSTSKYAERYVSHRVTFSLLSAIRMRFFDRLEPIANQLFLHYQSGELLARITNDVTTLQNFFLRVVYPPLIALLVFFGTVIFTAFFSIWIALLLVFGFLFVAVIIPALLIAKKTQPAPYKRTLMTETTEFLYGFRELKNHHLVDEKSKALLHLSDAYTEEVKKEQQALVRMQLYNQGASLLTVFLIVTIGAYFVTTNALDGLYLAMLLLIALTVFETAIPLATVPHHYKGATLAMARLQQVTAMPETDTKPLAITNNYSLQAKNVHFSYVHFNKPILKDIQFTIQPSEKIAIVGPSGSGKSTLFQLLIKGLEPTSGQLFINGELLANIEEASLWSQMSVQLQHNHFFSGTIRDNLLLANEWATDEQLINALNRARLSKSLDDVILEKGENLSGGERQRLAFARTLLKNGVIWLLDEPFTSLDAVTERALFHELLTSTKERTVILITHKLDGLEKMDRIFVMQDGQLAESGSYEQLLVAKGLFFEMKHIHTLHDSTS
ncbi:thiol reductant ABC exporter subunit CydC [Solibacillus sp. R5-41]|uniref:thiol reductant ABC exporter subunit CydC n=1 Tax=Solibacillus sp. R5-41 TaxID=2048654 RepID=UPI000C127BC8|nr:thiol reductant ABC exporter subunit CydC [Solibacillus sp. R5-41]ATP40546.1 thiol reductant ABC exporter subunit CydC [Solibacillus sp. R5-41]